MSPPFPIGVAILSWKSPQTIRNTLTNYAEGQILSLFEDVVLCFQEISDQDRALAEEFGIRCVGTPKNTGILGGFHLACDNLSSQYAMVLENDCLQREPLPIAKQRFTEALNLLEDGTADLFRMRSRYHPGPPVRAASMYSRFHPIRQLAHGWADAETLCTDPNWLRTLRRLARPGKARKWIGRSVYVEENPHQLHPRYIQKHGDNFLVDSAVLPWTNQPTLVKHSLLAELLDYADAHPSSRTINGFQDFEKNLNRNDWRNRHLKIGISPGIFTHQRLDR